VSHRDAGAAVKMYVRVMFSSEGASPITLIHAMADLGFTPVMGEYDFYFEIEEKAKNYREILKKLHTQLKGLNVMYTLTTKPE